MSSCKLNDTVSQPDFNQVKNVQWRLIAFDTLIGVPVNLNTADTIFLFLDDTRLVRGRSYGMCHNNYQGVYVFEGVNSIRFDSLITTEMACLNSRYGEYYYLLKSVNSFDVGASQLHLYFDGTEKKMVFERGM
jgi:heat shock protein HslJ